MAVSIVSVGTTAETATNVATPTTLSPGLPGTKAVGDILLCLTVCRSSTPTVSCSTAGWTELANVAATNGRIALYACKVTGSEAAAQPVWASLTTGTSGTGASAQIAAVRGLDTVVALTSLVHKLSAAQNQTASTTAQAMGATITPTNSNTAIFSLAIRQDNDVTDANWPVIGTLDNITWAKVAAVLNSASGADHAQSWQWGQQGAATAIGAKSVTVSGGSSDASSAILVSLLTLQAIMLTATAETEAAQTVSFAQAPQSKTVTAAAETGAAQALSFSLVASDQHKTLTAATETGAAQTVSFAQTPQTASLSAAAETDAAQSPGHSQAPQTLALTAAGETDAAQAAGHSQTPQTPTVPAATETGTAQALSLTQAAQQTTITAATCTGAAAAVSSSQIPISTSLAGAAETGAAIDLSIKTTVTHKTLNPAGETDTAVALSFTQTPQTITLAAAAGTSTAIGLSFGVASPQAVSISAASELDTATSLGNTQGSIVTLAAATETDLARTLTVAVGGVIPGASATGEILLAHEGSIEGPDAGELEFAHTGRIV